MVQKKSNTKKMVTAALLAAFTLLSTLLVQFPIAHGYVHLGDAFVFLSAFLLGPIWGAAAAGIGSALADIWSGYFIYAPATFVIKAAMAVVSWTICTALSKALKNQLFSELVACIIGACVLVAGYFLYETILYTMAGALAGVLWNCLQGGVGVLVAVFVMRLPVIKKLAL